jgi:hypothetical protein
MSSAASNLHYTCVRLKFVFAVLLALLAGSGVKSLAAGANAWIGTWYSETAENNIVDGKKYIIRREVLVFHDDVTMSATFRFYNGMALVDEFTKTTAWGVDGGVFSINCRTVLQYGSAAPCSENSRYDVVSVTPKEIRYKGKESGITYSILRVETDFRLP